MFEIITNFLDIFIHLDKFLPTLATTYGNLIYGILFTIIFCETGLVIAPFLPGDSLLFVAGSVAGLGGLNIWILLGVICLAAILGDSVNYFIGRFIGHKIMDLDLPMIRKEHLDKTHQYFDKYGSLTIIIARFAPFVRTLAPFLAGMGEMDYKKFLVYNVTGGILWVSVFLMAGYFIGTIPIIKENMSLVASVIILISLIAVGTLLIEICRFFGSCMIRRTKRS